MMTVAAVSDLMTMTISNKISMILFGGFFAAALLAGMPYPMIGWHMVIGLIVLIATFTMFAFNLLGGGDAKLAAVAALWFGTDQVFVFLIYTALFGGGLSLAILGFRKYILPPRLAAVEWIARLHQDGGDIPYGIALAAGAMVAFPETQWFKLLAAVL
nr:prepilin peptidase [Oryzibacter oryziterrae]